MWMLPKMVLTGERDPRRPPVDPLDRKVRCAGDPAVGQQRFRYDALDLALEHRITFSHNRVPLHAVVP